MPPMGTYGIPGQPHQRPAPQPNVQDEYQRLFGGGTAGQAASPVQGQPPVFGGATQSFQAPQMSAPSAAPVQAGPSEYTRMFSAPQEPAMPQQQAPAPQPPPVAPPKPAPKWPFFVFGAVILILIAAVIFLLMRG